MKKIEILRIINNCFLVVGVLGSLYLRSEMQSDELFKDTYINLITLGGVVSTVFTWLFIATFCDNANHSKEILTLLNKKKFKHPIEEKKKIDKGVESKSERIEVERIQKSISADEVVVKVKKSGKIEKITKEDWDEIVKIGNEDMFEKK